MKLADAFLKSAELRPPERVNNNGCHDESKMRFHFRFSTCYWYKFCSELVSYLNNAFFFNWETPKKCFPIILSVFKCNGQLTVLIFVILKYLFEYLPKST